MPACCTNHLQHASCLGRPRSKAPSLKSWDCQLHANHTSMAATQEMVEAKVVLMLQQLMLDCLTTSSAMERSMASRDALAFSLSWHVAARGINAGELTLQDFWLPASPMVASKSDIPYMYPQWQLPTGSAVKLIFAQTTRTKHSIEANRERIDLTVGDNMLLDPLRWVNIHMYYSAAAGSPVTHALIRPLERHGKAFAERSIRTNSLQSRLVSLLTRLGCYDGESMHSFRRGRAQHWAAEGVEHSAIMQRMLITTPRVITQHYLPAGRYHSGVERPHQAHNP